MFYNMPYFTLIINLKKTTEILLYYADCKILYGILISLYCILSDELDVFRSSCLDFHQ